MKPSDEEKLLAGLKALRDKTAGEGPSSSIEAALLGEFRRRRLRKEAKFVRKPWVWVGLAATAAAALFAVLPTTRPEPRHVAKADIGPALPPAVKTVERQTAAVAPDPPQPAPRARRRVGRMVRQSPPPVAPVPEVATDFLPVPYAPRFTAEDRGQLVRVRLPRESMRSFGLPVNQDRILSTVQADVLIGEDGLARAIRFVQ
jgi:hypothetical protein